ncbi:beta-ketoacyl-ACP synthase III [Streptomyces sp. NBC_00102]|uniref:beta-ketoacyl-ACP synthase III n=1 Tax=Streptomyces sp. NBC_00102 TaxID=2975652 RepID=UPI00225B6B53|nr:beta-ketoacyl-ACP synthase III [Streptomyces sp. NBC_00102]MCX5395491.1 ketoacyl-ACP synthase III [Streptomyces sp. NBC_00102]
MTPACVVERVAGWVPPQRVTNDDLPASWEVTDDWVRSRTGIASRHRAAPGTATSDVALKAAARVLEGAGTVDTLLLATSTPDHPIPATAPAVAARLGLGPVAAFDIAAVCSGFVYGLATGAGLIASGMSRRLLLVGADVYSNLLDPTDRSSGILFGDGAGAVLLRAGEPGEPGELLGCHLGSDGGNAGLITVPDGGARSRAAGVPPGHGDHHFRMQGADVYKQAVVRMTQSARGLLERLGWDGLDVDHFVPHQANARILEAVSARLRIPYERCVLHLAEVGNTGAASIPLALADAQEAGRLREGDRVLITAFGGGLTWGSAAFTWPSAPAGPITTTTAPRRRA